MKNTCCAALLVKTVAINAIVKLASLMKNTCCAAHFFVAFCTMDPCCRLCLGFVLRVPGSPGDRNLDYVYVRLFFYMVRRLLEALQQLQGAQMYFHCFNNVSEHRWHAPGFLRCYVNWSSNLFRIPCRITLVSHIFHNVGQFAILFHYVNNSSIFTNSVPTSNAIHLTSARLFPFWFHPLAP